MGNRSVSQKDLVIQNVKLALKPGMSAWVELKPKVTPGKREMTGVSLLILLIGLRKIANEKRLSMRL